MLKYRRHRDEGIALQAPINEVTPVVYAELRLAFQHHLFNRFRGRSFDDVDVEPFIQKEALRQRGVVAGKLKLVIPLELQA